MYGLSWFSSWWVRERFWPQIYGLGIKRRLWVPKRRISLSNSQEGKPINLHDFRGKWVVLYFYPKDMTTGCTIEAHNFQRDMAKYEAKNAVILGVSVQDEKSHQEFCAKESLNFKLLADTNHEVSEKYDSLTNYGVAKLSARHTFLIDPTGKVRKVWTDVDVKKHSDEVLAALDELSKS